jgi:hypothetical protein
MQNANVAKKRHSGILLSEPGSRYKLREVPKHERSPEVNFSPTKVTIILMYGTANSWNAGLKLR